MTGWRVRIIGVAAALGCIASSAGAQGAKGAPSAPGPFREHGAPAGEARVVSGRVVRAGADGATGVPGVWAVLHRVGTDKAAPLDSVRTAAGGAYRFAYTTSGDARALYFVSTSVGGVAYFTAPLKARTVRGADADLVTYDTSSAPVPIRTRARHLVVSAPDSAGTRTIVEIFELSNDSTVTRIARGDSVPVWDAGMLERASDPRVGQADFAADAVTFTAGRARLFAPFAPGLKQLSFTYKVKAKEAEYPFLLDAPTAVLEVLVEDAAATVQGGGVVAARQADLGGRAFKRWLAQDVPANTIVRVAAPTLPAATSGQLKVMIIITAVGALLLAGLAAAMMRKPLVRT